MNKARFEAFSDAVFAFGATLLVLGFVPELNHRPPSDSEMTAALLHLWPNLLAYILSFSVIGIMWQNHHALFRLIDRIDRGTVFFNLMLLAVTAFIPFATSVLGAYPQLKSTAFLYGVTLTASATCYNLLLDHLVRRRAFASEVTEQTIRQTRFAYRAGWVTYSVATLAALVSPAASFTLYVAIALFYLIPRGVDTDLTSPSSS